MSAPFPCSICGQSFWTRSQLDVHEEDHERQERKYHWRCRLVKGAAWIPVVSWYGAPIVDGEVLDRSPRWQCLVRLETTARAILAGEPAPVEVDGVTLLNIEPITEADYQFLKEHTAWATEHMPSHPEASPRSKVDLKGRFIW